MRLLAEIRVQLQVEDYREAGTVLDAIEHEIKLAAQNQIAFTAAAPPRPYPIDIDLKVLER